MARQSVRIIPKHGKEADWNKIPDFVPYANELIIYEKDETHETARMKTGDGVTRIVDLPFMFTGSIPGFDPENIVAKKVEHKLRFGADRVYEFDGSADVTVPVYTGAYTPNVVDGDAGYQEDNFDDD